MKNSSTYVNFSPLFVRKEGKKYLLGHAEKGNTLLVPPIGYRAILLLRERSIEETGKYLTRRGKTPVRVMDFVKTLKREGLVEGWGPHPFLNPKPRVFVRRSFRVWLLGAFFGASLLLGLAALALILKYPHYRPSSQDFFWSGQDYQNLLSFLGASSVLIWTHEGAHALAAFLGGGIRARFSFSYRFIFLVAQTQFPLIWRLPRLERSFIYLFGMAWDIFWISNLLLIRHFLREVPSVVSLSPFLGQLILVGVLGLSWEFLFVFRNDVYFLISDWLGRFNLHAEAFSYLGSLVKGKPLKVDPLTKAYGFLAVFVSLAVLKIYGPIPLLILGRMIGVLSDGLRAYPSSEFWDALLVSLYFGASLLIYFGLVGRDFLRKKGKPLR